MVEQRSRATGSGVYVVPTALLPDLTDVDLRTLRAMDDPGLRAAVEQVLHDAAWFREVWYGDTEPTPSGPGGLSGRMFSAGLGERGQGEGERA
ncbi:hypothetical protein [Streptomyces sp. NPDC046805]|uniref:hypothetical protein n=1 Tax=Streptomyces sp. NPDC046805 TaxID=3155134 RepID=UPI0033D970D1